MFLLYLFFPPSREVNLFFNLSFRTPPLVSSLWSHWPSVFHSLSFLYPNLSICFRCRSSYHVTLRLFPTLPRVDRRYISYLLPDSNVCPSGTLEILAHVLESVLESRRLRLRSNSRTWDLDLTDLRIGTRRKMFEKLEPVYWNRKTRSVFPPLLSRVIHKN